MYREAPAPAAAEDLLASSAASLGTTPSKEGTKLVAGLGETRYFARLRRVSPDRVQERAAQEGEHSRSGVQ